MGTCFKHRKGTRWFIKHGDQGGKGRVARLACRLRFQRWIHAFFYEEATSDGAIDSQNSTLVLSNNNFHHLFFMKGFLDAVFAFFCCLLFYINVCIQI